MNLIRDVICFTSCMICLIFYAVGALSIIPFIVFFIVIFRLMEMICALLTTPFLLIIEKTSNKTFKRYGKLDSSRLGDFGACDCICHSNCEKLRKSNV